MSQAEFNAEQKKKMIEGQIVLLNHMLQDAGKKEKYKLVEQ